MEFGAGSGGSSDHVFESSGGNPNLDRGNLGGTGVDPECRVRIMVGPHLSVERSGMGDVGA